MEHYGKIVNSFKYLTIFVKRSFIDIWQESKYASDQPLKRVNEQMQRH